MPISAERRRDARAGSRRQSGFTLLEVMVTLAVVVLAIVPMLFERDKAWNMALRTSNLMKASTYADRVLAEHLLDVDDRKEWPGVIEDDPVFRYELTIESYDISTGRTESEEEDQGFGDGTAFSETPAFTPPDALEAPPELEQEQDLDDPHRVRRYRIVMRFPGYGEEEQEEEYVLEGYAPLPRREPAPGSVK